MYKYAVLKLPVVGEFRVLQSHNKENYKEREEQYLALAAKYSKERINKFPEMLGYLVMVFDKFVKKEEVRDILGWLFEEFELHNKCNGQFFTLEHICRFMAEITAENKSNKTVEEKGFVTVKEPCCDSGRIRECIFNCVNGNNILKNRQL